MATRKAEVYATRSAAAEQSDKPRLNQVIDQLVAITADVVNLVDWVRNYTNDALGPNQPSGLEKSLAGKIDVVKPRFHALQDQASILQNEISELREQIYRLREL